MLGPHGTLVLYCPGPQFASALEALTVTPSGSNLILQPWHTSTTGRSSTPKKLYAHLQALMPPELDPAGLNELAGHGAQWVHMPHSLSTRDST